MLHIAAQHGRWCLVLGLAAGLLLPGLAEALRPHLPLMIAALLFLAAFRIGPDSIWHGLRSDFTTIKLVAMFQVALPLTIFGVTHAFGVAGTTAGLAAVLVFSAPSVTGSANFAMIMGAKPEAALRLLLVGTALFPLTVLPVLLLISEIDTGNVLFASVRLILVIGFAGGLAFLLRRGRWQNLTRSQEQSIDGASAILLGVVVIGLMSAVGPMLLATPSSFAMWLAFATALNIGAQLLVFNSVAKRVAAVDRSSVSIVAGNRNIALFLLALPPEISFELLSFIGCYQIPMYLTPLLLGRMYRRAGQ